MSAEYELRALAIPADVQEKEWLILSEEPGSHERFRLEFRSLSVANGSVTERSDSMAIDRGTLKILVAAIVRILGKKE